MLEPIPNMPRDQAGSNPQYLLVTLFGDFWPGLVVDLPSAGLVALLLEFDVTPSGARSALSRLSARGVIEASKIGRNTFYRPSEDVVSVGIRSLPRIFEFASEDDGAEWDGTWTLVAFSIPEEQRHLRSPLRSKLRWHRYAPLQDGVWISAGAPTDDLLRDVEEIPDEYLTVFNSTAIPAGTVRARGPVDVDEMQSLGTEYEDFIDEYGAILERANRGLVSPRQAFLDRVRLMSSWRGFYRADPRLPKPLLPESWRRREAGEVFLATYQALGPLAEFHARQLLSSFDLTDEQLPRHYDVTTLMEHVIVNFAPETGPLEVPDDLAASDSEASA